MPDSKKVSCVICGTEHTAGESCPECGWDQKKEENRARGELIRQQMRDELLKKQKKGKGTWDD